MSKLIEQKFRQSVCEHLTKLDAQLIEVLASLIQYHYPPQVFAICFEVFTDGFTQEFPVRAFFMDHSNSEYFIVQDGEYRYPSPVDPGLLELDYVYPQALEDEFIAATDLDAWEIATDELIYWFAQHWQQNGGTKFPLVATISTHDAAQEFNLKSQKWQPINTAFAL
jgi:hypothetical protein